MTEDNGKTFRVVDKRRIGREDAPEEKNDVPHIEKKAHEETGTGDGKQDEAGTPRTAQEKAVSEEYSQMSKTQGSYEPDFSDIVKSFFMQALASLGMLEGEGVEPGPPNLELARQYIDLLGVLERKTRGNLSKDEEMLIREYLSQLRMVYVKMTREKTNNP